MLACVASVSVWFRSKERGTRVKDHVKNGTSERAEGEWGGRKESSQFILLSKKSPSVRPNVWKKCGDRFLNYLNSLMKISICQYRRKQPRSLNEFTILFLLVWKKYDNGNSKRLTANATLKFQTETLKQETCSVEEHMHSKRMLMV